MLGFFEKKLNRAKTFSLPLETVTDKGILDLSELKKGMRVLALDEKGKEVTNRVESVERIVSHGVYYCVNDRMLLYENQSIRANGNVIHAKQLKLGDELVALGGKTVVVHELKKIKGRYIFYRLKVDGDHQYFLNGILVHNASRFWVGGTGAMDGSTTTNIAATSGGAGGASYPTSSDDMTFDALSNATAYTVTYSGTNNCLNLTLGAPLVGALTWAGSTAIGVFGNFSVASGTTRTYTGTITFSATSTGKTITMNTVVLAGSVTFNGSGGGWTLQDTFDIGTGTLTLTNGTLDTNGVTVTCGVAASGLGGFTSAAGTSTLTLGASTFNINNSCSFIQVDNLNANTSSIVYNTQNNNAFNGGGKTFNNVTINGAATQQNLGGTNTFANLTLTGSAVKTHQFMMTNNQTVTTLLTIAGNSVTNRVLVLSGLVGTASTITAANATVSNADFMDITGAGAFGWNLSGISGNSGDCGGNSGITFTTPADQHFTNTSGGTWSTSGNWTSRVPLPQDNVFFDLTFTTSRTVTADMPRMGANISWASAAWTTSLTWTSTITMATYGTVALITGLSITGSGTLDFRGRTAVSLTSFSVSIAWLVRMSGPGGTLSLGDALLTTSQLRIEYGNFNASNNNVTCTLFNNGSTSQTRTITMGSGTWTITGVGSTVFDGLTTGLTINGDTALIKITDTTNGVLTFAGGGKTYYNLWFARGASTGSITISGSNIFNQFKDTGTAAHSILFTAATTQRIADWQVSGAGGGVRTIINSTTTGIHTLIKTGGGQVSADWLDIQHSVAQPAATTWYAGANSTDNQAVATAGSGWVFTVPPAQQSADFMHPVNQPTSHWNPAVLIY